MPVHFRDLIAADVDFSAVLTAQFGRYLVAGLRCGRIGWFCPQRKRRLRRICITPSISGRMTEKENQEERSDVTAVDIGVGHDNFVIPRL